MSGLDPERIVVTTTFENRAPYTAEVEILYRTLAAYGGELARARRIACAVGPPDPFVVEVLADLDVEVREVAPFDERCPHANKVAMLDLAGDGDFVLALDTDVAVAGDPSAWLSPGSVVAKPVDMDPIGLDGWPALFAARGLDVPRGRHLCDFTALETIPYFNSGVVGVPAAWCEQLGAAWREEVTWLLDSWDELPPSFGQHRFFTDQFALALALARLELPVRALPVECNFPTHHPLHRSLGPDARRPALLHHHHLLRDDGELLPCTHPGANDAIERVNVELRRDPDAEAAAPGQGTFDNQRFWNERYRTNMELGSGIGSRGELLVRKRALLQAIIDEGPPGSILDIGCGDLEIVRGLRYDGAYTGVDISDVVVERNRALVPHWTFEHGEFTALAQDRDLSADVVLCLDVLIHQHERGPYEQFVRELVRATRAVGVVAAYDAPPAAEHASDITAWHGPITELLRASGARDVEVVDEYRGTAVVRYRAATARPWTRR